MTQDELPTKETRTISQILREIPHAPPHDEIGRMTVAFNNLELAVHVLCWPVIEPEGHTRNWPIGRAVTANLQAQQVGELLGRLSGHVSWVPAAGASVELAEISRDFLRLINRRNEITHSVWPLAQGDSRQRVGRTVRVTINDPSGPAEIDPEAIREVTASADALYLRIFELTIRDATPEDRNEV